jgi:hypothetical protein
MNAQLGLKIGALATGILTVLTFPMSSIAATYGQTEVDADRFIAIAAPYGYNQYNLLVIEQIPGQKTCWQEKGTKPVSIDPLLLNFDFTGSCNRSTDSNGYSIRIAEQDYGLNYLLSVVERNGELFLIGISRRDRSQPEIVLGRSYGVTGTYTKIFLNPGWRFTRRTYQGKTLGHVYFTGDNPSLASGSIGTNTNTNNSSSNKKPSIFVDRPNKKTSNNNTNNNREIIFQAPTNNNNNNSQSPNNTLPPPSSNGNNNLENSSALPPPPNNLNSGRKNLGDLLVVAPGANGDDDNSTNNNLSVPNINIPSGQTRPNNNTTNVSNVQGYRVLVEAKNNDGIDRVKSLYPEAFRTNYNGKSMLQVGRFTSREKADITAKSLEDLGMKVMIVK